MTLQARDVSWQAGGALIVDQVSLTPDPGSTVGLLGPNGSGKSTLLRLLAGVRSPTAGVVTLDGQPVNQMSRRRISQRLAVVDQHAETDVDVTVADVIALGRIPHRLPWSAPSPADDEAIAEAVAFTGLEPMLDRSWHTLSGGEQQRVQIARALAQQPRELLLDEPTNHLDVRHQLEILALVARIPVTSVIALHDLNLAAVYCDQLVVLQHGRAVAAGTPHQVLTSELISQVYGVQAQVDLDGPGGAPFVRFIPTEFARSVSERAI